MANDAGKARARRKLEREGGKNLPALTIFDTEAWTQILVDEGWIAEGEEVDVHVIRRGTENWIKDLCRDYRREEADKLVFARTGVLEREQPPPQAINVPPAHPLSTRFSEGGHWSFRPGNKKDRGRRFTAAEKEAYVRDHPEVLNGGLKGMGWMERRAILGLDDDIPEDDGDVVTGEDGHGYQEGES